MIDPPRVHRHHAQDAGTSPRAHALEVDGAGARDRVRGEAAYGGEAATDVDRLPEPGPSPVVLRPVEPPELPASAWITGAKPRRPRTRLSISLTVAAVVIGGLVVFGIAGQYLGLFQPRGQVLFGTSLGPDLCSVGGETRTVTSSDPVFFAAVLRHRLGGDGAVRLTVTRDGEPFFDNRDPPNGTEFDCYGSREAVGPLEPGVYVFEVTHEDEVEAAGSLTVT